MFSVQTLVQLSLNPSLSLVLHSLHAEGLVWLTLFPVTPIVSTLLNFLLFFFIFVGRGVFLFAAYFPLQQSLFPFRFYAPK